MRRTKIAGLLVLTLIFTLLTAFGAVGTLAQDKPNEEVSADIASEDGLESVSFHTLNGVVEVDLPDDVASSDTLSGTVIAEPQGETEEEITQNQTQLNGYVVEIAKTEEVKEPPAAVVAERPGKEPSKSAPKKEPGSSPAKDKPTSHSAADKPLVPDPYAVPPVISKKPPCISVSKDDHTFCCLVLPTTAYFSIVLKKKSGEEVCRQSVRANPAPKPTSPISKSNPPACEIPQEATGGKPLVIPGKCDGRSATSKIKINGHLCKVLAESPRRQIVRIPKDLSGPCTIERSECGYVKKGTIRVRPAQVIASVPPPARSSDLDLSGIWEMECKDLGMTQTIQGETKNYPPQVTATGSYPIELIQQGNQLTLRIAPGGSGTGDGGRKVITYTGSFSGSSGEVCERSSIGTSKYDNSMRLTYDQQTDTIAVQAEYHTTVWNGTSLSRYSCTLRRKSKQRPISRQTAPPLATPKQEWVFRRTGPYITGNDSSPHRAYKVAVSENQIQITGPQSCTVSFTPPPEILRVGDRFSLAVQVAGQVEASPKCKFNPSSRWLYLMRPNQGVATLRRGYEGGPSLQWPIEVQDWRKVYLGTEEGNPSTAGDLPLLQLRCAGTGLDLPDVELRWPYVVDSLENTARGRDAVTSAGSALRRPELRNEARSSEVRRDSQEVPQAGDHVPLPTVRGNDDGGRVPQSRSSQDPIAQVKELQLRQLRDVRQQDFAMASEAMAGTNAAEINARAERRRRETDALAEQYARSMDDLESKLKSLGYKIAYVNYKKLTSDWRETRQLGQMPGILKSQIDSEARQKLTELTQLELRNPQQAMRQALDFKSDLFNRMKEQLDALQSRWIQVDKTIQSVCAQAGARHNVDFVSFRSPDGIDLTDEVLSILQSSR